MGEILTGSLERYSDRNLSRLPLRIDLESLEGNSWGSLDQYRDRSRSRVMHGSKGSQDRYRDRSRSRVKHGSKGSQEWYRDRSRSKVTHENRNREDSPLGSEIGSQQINAKEFLSKHPTGV